MHRLKPWPNPSGQPTAGNVLTETLPTSVGYVVTSTYDEAGRLTSIANAKPGQAALSEFAYTLDPVGNPTQVVTHDETITYDYDDLERLVEVCYLPGCTGSGLAGISYTYDGVGNRLTEVRHSTTDVTSTYTYNADDQLTEVAGAGPAVPYAYSPNGNQIAAGARTFTYDLENRLLSTTEGPATHDYLYDGAGNRLEDSWGTLPSEEVDYLWDPNARFPLLAVELDGTGSHPRRYTFGLGLLSMATPGGISYYLPDSLGSTVNVASSSGEVQWSYWYEPFGAVRSELQGDLSAPGNLMRFNGQLIDTADGLYDLRARMYDPLTGRFLGPDPITTPPSVPYSSAYVYANNQPTVLVDPTGRASESGSDSESFLAEVYASFVEGLDEVPWGGLMTAFAQCTTTGVEVAVAAAPAGAALGVGESAWLVGTFLFGCAAGVSTPPTGPAPVG